MFGIFRKKTPLEKLNQKYKKTLKEAFELSKTNRKESDKKQVEAEKIMNEIEKLKNK